LVALDLLILLWVGGVITEEVKVAQGSTCSRHDFLEHLLLLIFEVLLFLVVTLVARVILIIVVVVVLIGGVGLLPLMAVSDELGGVVALEATSRWPLPLLAELV
jgi:hypothetical protein